MLEIRGVKGKLLHSLVESRPGSKCIKCHSFAEFLNDPSATRHRIKKKNRKLPRQAPQTGGGSGRVAVVGKAGEATGNS